jgi:hypothetical protein
MGICQEECDVTGKMRNAGKNLKCHGTTKSAVKDRKSGKKTTGKCQ